MARRPGRPAARTAPQPGRDAGRRAPPGRRHAPAKRRDGAQLGGRGREHPRDRCGDRLGPGGVAFVSVDTHHLVWGVGARLYNAFGERTGRYPHVPAFPNHPFHFTLAEVDALLAATSLEILERRVPEGSFGGRLSARRPYDVLKRVFFKNRRVELLLRKPPLI